MTLGSSFKKSAMSALHLNSFLGPGRKAVIEKLCACLSEQLACPTLGREADRRGMLHFRGQPWLRQTSRTSPKRSEDSLCCLKKWWDYVVSLESGGEASTRSEWIYRLAVGSSGLWTFFFPTSQPLFAGALGGPLKCLSLRLLKCCTTEYSWICYTLFCSHQQQLEEWQDHDMCTWLYA